MKIDWYIIRKVLEKTAEPHEIEIYRKWLDAVPRHREYINAIARYTGHARQIGEDELTEGWQEAIRKIRQRSRRQIWLRWSSVAALVALALGFGFYFTRTTTPEMSPLALLEPEEAVTMILSDGKIYNLEKGNDSSMVAVMDLSKKNASFQEKATRVIDVPRGKSWRFTLAEGSVVYLNAHSRLSFSEDIAVASERRVVLEYGEAYFEVKKDTERPFIVVAGEVENRVYGTEFNVDSYSPDRPRTTLVEGSVGMRWSGNREELRLKPGQQGFPDAEGKFRIKEVDVEEIFAWKENVFLFKNTALEEIAKRLEDWYRVEFRFVNEQLKKELLYCRLSRASSLETILNALGSDGKIHFTYRDGIVTVY